MTSPQPLGPILRSLLARPELYLTCDNIEGTLADLSDRGVEIVHPVADRGWGLLASIRMPSGGELGVYEPRHATAYRRS